MRCLSLVLLIWAAEGSFFVIVSYCVPTTRTCVVVADKTASHDSSLADGFVFKSVSSSHNGFLPQANAEKEEARDRRGPNQTAVT